MPRLLFLDDQLISENERQEAAKMYGPRMRTNSSASLRNGGNGSRKSRTVRESIVTRIIIIT